MATASETNGRRSSAVANLQQLRSQLGNVAVEYVFKRDVLFQVTVVLHVLNVFLYTLVLGEYRVCEDNVFLQFRFHSLHVGITIPTFILYSLLLLVAIVLPPAEKAKYRTHLYHVLFACVALAFSLATLGVTADNRNAFDTCGKPRSRIACTAIAAASAMISTALAAADTYLLQREQKRLGIVETSNNGDHISKTAMTNRVETIETDVEMLKTRLSRSPSPRSHEVDAGETTVIDGHHHHHESEPVAEVHHDAVAAEKVEA